MHYIEFPGLWNLRFNINPIAVKIGNINIYWYGIIIATAVFMAMILAMKDVNKFGYTDEDVLNVLLVAIPFSLIGARSYYVIFNRGMFNNVWDILNTRTGGLAIYGGIIGGILAVYIYCKYKRYDFLNFVDFFMPYLALGQMIGRWGNFTNQEAFGRNTDLIWGMTGDIIKKEILLMKENNINMVVNMPVHPTFIYESLWDMGIFIILYINRKRKKFNGDILCNYMILYGIGRFFIEGLRVDSLMFSNFRVSQLVSCGIVLMFSVFKFVKVELR